MTDTLNEKDGFDAAGRIYGWKDLKRIGEINRWRDSNDGCPKPRIAKCYAGKKKPKTKSRVFFASTGQQTKTGHCRL